VKHLYRYRRLFNNLTKVRRAYSQPEFSKGEKYSSTYFYRVNFGPYKYKNITYLYATIGGRYYKIPKNNPANSKRLLDKLINNWGKNDK
jgi:hypothetical protein